MTEDVPAVAMVNFNMILFYYVAESGLQTRRTGQTREQVSLLLERFGNESELSHMQCRRKIVKHEPTRTTFSVLENPGAFEYQREGRKDRSNIETNKNTGPNRTRLRFCHAIVFPFVSFAGANPGTA